MDGRGVGEEVEEMDGGGVGEEVLLHSALKSSACNFSVVKSDMFSISQKSTDFLCTN